MWVGRTRTKSALCLVISHFGLWCGERSWPLSAQLTLSLTAEAVRDGACGCPVSRELRWALWCSEVSLFDASPWGGAVVAASIPDAVVKETGRYNDRWRFSPFSGRKNTSQISSTIRTSVLVVAVNARFTASHTRGMESIDGAEETHAQSPQHAPWT